MFDDLLNHPDIHKEVDATSAASALHDVISLFGDTSTPSDLGTTSIGDSPTTPQTPSTPTSQGNGTDRASPVPEGTGISQGFGAGNDHDAGGHPGIDFSVPLDTQLLAAASGTVTHASNDDPGGYGEWVEITTPDGIAIRYGHLHGANVKVGDTVRAGQVIGTSGGEKGGSNSGNSTGAHLHFEVRHNGQAVDPTPFLAGGYQIIGGSTTDQMTPTTADPQQLARSAVKDVVNAISGKPIESDQSTQTTDKGATSAGDTDPGGVDAFLAATRKHESGGDYTIYNQSGLSNASGAYQFIGSTWKGLGGSTANAADASPAEQDRIARDYAMQLFNQFHSWRLVAIAWYGGPGVAQQVAAGRDPGAPDQQGGYLAYGDTIARMMAGG